MVPETAPKEAIKKKLSNDAVGQLISLVLSLTFVAYYLFNREWHYTNPIGFVLIVILTISQVMFLRLHLTKDNEFFNSGGFYPLFVYNISLIIVLVFYVPLYSPFILAIPAVAFVTVYYRGISMYYLSIIVLVSIVLLSYLNDGLPNVSHAKIYPIFLIILGVIYLSLVKRAGSLDSNIRKELSMASEQISEEREQLSSLINGLKDTVIATDEDGNIIFYNTESLKLLNLDNIVIGEPFSKFVRLYDERESLVDFFSLFVPELDQQSITNLHILYNNNDSMYVSIEISKVISKDTKNKVQGVIILIRDITKEKTLDEERNEFVAVTSHELRTPIAIAEANLSMAMDKRLVGNLDQSIQDRLKQAHDGIMNLSDLVNQLTELSDVERKNIEVENQLIDPILVLMELAKDYESDIREKGLKLEINKPVKVGQIYTSKIYLREILDNFMTNAIKYTQNGKVIISVNISSKYKDHVVFSVEDTGDGIGNSDKDRIFTKFYRAEDYRTRHTRGTGLGLYLTLRLARSINGKIWFTSELKKGSNFHLEVPLTNQVIAQK